eukprot:13343.XXX_268142_265920_1 [CDS] Oithona nana genome sequencing.
MYDLVIRNGRLIDPANSIDEILDLAVQDGKIAEVGIGLPKGRKQDVDATDCIVTPGLIDIHTHVYEHATLLGINPDQTCLSRGVTTVVDAGSAGCMTFRGLRKYICEKSATRVLALLNIACHGLAGAGCAGEEFGPGGENDHLNALKLRQCIECIEANRDLIVRLDRNITDNGRTELEAFSRAQMASASCKVPLMVHHTNSNIKLESGKDALISCPGSLKKGDVYTHTFHGHQSSIYDPTTKTIHPSIMQLQRNVGVLFDVGHGQGSFDWKVAEAAAQQGFWTDLISTDLHSGNVNGLAKDLPNVMTKLKAVGMPIPKIIEASTWAPAKAINREDDLGSLSIGREADISLLQVRQHQQKMEDSFGVCKIVEETIVPKAVWRAGQAFPIKPRDHDPTV